MYNNLFKCTDNTVNNIYNLFDKIMSMNNDLLRVILRREEVDIVKDYKGDTSIQFGNSSLKWDSDILKELNAKAIFGRGNNDISDLFMLRDLSFNDAYLYKKSDILRCSEDYGIVGFRNNYANVDGIYPPKSLIPFKDICEVREKYSSLISNDYKIINIPKEFKNIISNKDYNKLFENMIAKGFTVNSLYEKNGGIFCRNISQGNISIDSLKGVESDFYNELLEVVVSLGKPVNFVYFYSDLNWTSLFYRESKKVKGEFELLLK